MSYEKQEWFDGDIITAEKLNHIEEGIFNANKNDESHTEAEHDAKDFEPQKVNQIDVIEAQVLYTALMTDTLIEGGDDDV